jgi:hypothetical protein
MHPLLTAARLLVRDMGGAEDAAKHLGKRGSSLNHELDPNYEGAKFGLLDAATLTQAALAEGVRDAARIATAFAAECGGTFLPLPQSAQTHDDTLRHVSELVTAFGQALAEVTKAVEDGKVNDNELATVQAESLQVIGALQRLVVHLGQLNAAGKPAHIRRAA